MQQRLLGIIYGLLAGVALLGVLLFSQIIIFAAIVVVWISIMVLLLLKYKKLTLYNIFTIFVSALSCVLLILFVELAPLKYFFILLACFIFIFLWHWMDCDKQALVSFQQKHLRRIMVMLNVFNVYAWCTGLLAFHSYFINIPFWVLGLIVVAICAGSAFSNWRLYFRDDNKRLLLWSGIVGIMTLEVVLVFRLLPFGYLATSFLLAWIWYIAQLFIRFHLAPQGIVWKRQRWFLAVNVVLFVLTLYFIRWI